MTVDKRRLKEHSLPMSQELSGKIPPEVLQGLTMKWLDCFISAVRVGDRKGFGELFLKECIVFGGEKGGCVDWGMAYQLEIDTANCKISVFDQPHGTLCVVDWRANPIVDVTQSKRGHATFLLLLVPGSRQGQLKFECMHAHFSQLNA